MICTTIYWLVDMRPEVIAAGFPRGVPFYCGMTKGPLRKILSTLRKSGRPALAEVAKECGAHIEVRVMELVAPLDGKREKLAYWRRKMAVAQRPTTHRLHRVNRKPQFLTKQEAWVERQRIIAIRNRKLSPPPY
jgi:hypothetical protein